MNISRYNEESATIEDDLYGIEGNKISGLNIVHRFITGYQARGGGFIINLIPIYSGK